MIARMVSRIEASRWRSAQRWRLTAVSCLFAFVVGVPAMAYAACVAPTLPRAARLAQIASRRGGFDVAFVGRLIRRLPAVKRSGGVFTPLDFEVTTSFAGDVGRRARVLVNGGCVGGSCLGVEDTFSYTYRGYQLVLADRGPAGLVSASACTDAGPAF